MKKIIYTNSNGGLSVISPADNVATDGKYFISFDKTKGIPEEFVKNGFVLATIEQIAQKDVPSDATDMKIIDDPDFPSDRTFRNAWQQTAGKVSVDMAKAKDIQKQILRDQRQPLLDNLDVEFTKAVAANDQKQMKSIEDQRQALRDITDDPSIAAAQTPDELKAVTIQEILK